MSSLDVLVQSVVLTILTLCASLIVYWLLTDGRDSAAIGDDVANSTQESDALERDTEHLETVYFPRSGSELEER